MLRRGRRLKTKLRLGCHELNDSASRSLPGIQRDSNRTCKCCSLQAKETAAHTLYNCPAYDAIRVDFLQRVEKVAPGASSLNQNEFLKLFLGDSTPKSVSLYFYRFLMNLFDERECRLVDLAAREESSRALVT